MKSYWAAAVVSVFATGIIPADEAEPPSSPILRRPPVTKAIAPDNPDKGIVEAEIAAIVASYKKPAYVPPRMEKPRQIETEALGQLFPKHRFYVIRWSEGSADTPEGRMVSVAGGLYFTLVIPPQGKPSKLYGSGNYEEFGAFLGANKVQLRSPDDARLIWVAFCDAHVRPLWKAEQTRQVSPTEWALGENQIGEFKYSYRLTLDDDHVVTAATLTAEKTAKPGTTK